MTPLFDTIVAPITGPGPAAVSVIRLSGPDAWEIAAKVFPNLPSTPRPRYLYYGAFLSGDDGYAVLFEEGRSYTGELAAEMSIHGSVASIDALVRDCCREGARQAEGGEFTQRAFLNGRIDLTQAEAVRETIEAQAEAQLKLANLHREGALHREIHELSDRTVGVLAAIEASVDFSEEVGEIDRDDLVDRLLAIRARIEALISQARHGRILREGLRIAIVGPPNAGKSSLLNRLLGADRAIVTEIPGTTRDYVEERLQMEGYYVVLIDTAGLRDSLDPVESLGIQRSRAMAAQADWVWYVFDTSVGLTESDRTFLASFGDALVLANKSDLATDVDHIAISALTGEGIEALHERVKLRFASLSPQMPIPTSRHRDHLSESLTFIDDARATLQSSRPDDLAAVSLRGAISAFGEITGETASPDMIQRIFRDFCIGK